MKAEEIVFFLKKAEHTVFSFNDLWFYNDYRQKRIFTAFPPQKLIAPLSVDLDRFLKYHPKLLGVRYWSPSSEKGVLTHRWICKKPYDLDRLSSKVRNRTRFGLKNCSIRKMGFKELSDKAWPALKATMERHGEEVPKSLGFNLDMENCPAYEAWGAFVGEASLAAYMVTLTVENWAHILIQRSVSEHLKYYPNNALVFTVVKTLLKNNEIDRVNYGYEFFKTPSSLADFKESLGFEREFVRQRIVLSKKIRFFLSKPACGLLQSLLSFFPKTNRVCLLSKFLSLVRES